MKTILFNLSLLVFSNFCFGQNQIEEYKKMLIGRWEYDVAYDTIAVANHGKNDSDYFFFIAIKISNDKIKVSDITKSWKGEWEVKNDNEFIIYLDNKKTLKYYITKLTNNHLELQSFGVAIPTLGYKRK